MKQTATLYSFFGFLKSLSLQLFFIFILLFCLNSFAQGPGCPNVNAGGNIELDCDQPCTDLSATFLQTGETTSYEVAPIDYNPPFPSTGGTPISVNTDDVWSDPIPLPFDFCFYGGTYSEILIGSNGVITFDLVNNEPNGFCDWSFSDPIPSNNLFSTTIFGPYMDIDPSIDGSGIINYTIFGEVPCRTMVVNFPVIPYFSCEDLNMTTQIVIYETTNVVEIYLENRSDACSNWNSGNAVIGLQNQNGTEGISAPNRNTGNWSAINEAWRFTPNGNSNVAFSWLNENNEVISTDPIINVCPTDEVTTYTAQAVYTNCNGDEIIENDEVIVTFNGGFIIDLGGNQEFCDEENYTITADLAIANPEDASFLWSNNETTQSITVTESDIYTVEVTYGNCTLSESVSLSFGISPLINLGEDIETCFENNIVLDATPSNMDPNDVTYLWNTGATSPSIIVNEIGNYSVIASFGDCEVEDSITISGRTDLNIDVNDDFKSCIGEEWTITANTNEEGVTFQWYLNGELITGETSSTLVLVVSENSSDIENYSVVINKGDCTGTDDVNIELYNVSNCVITQGISPDATPGFNDYLDLEFLSDRTGGITNLQIFNRYGTIVFNKNNYINEWKGQDKNGNKLPTGTYYYAIEFASTDDVYGPQTSGWIYLNRNAN
ncbi:gliding motility-associated C-terminal domain-containing protein [Flavobacteriaceae bacterium]|nr:gliding motility-associated C-terminal domain-containing protein [Flavobacteriaceae bacterium]MDB9989611.1 gliding motility-associated C-terminal domain-containing protein [Flavobacteriaceae bacterium]